MSEYACPRVRITMAPQPHEHPETVPPSCQSCRTDLEGGRPSAGGRVRCGCPGPQSYVLCIHAGRTSREYTRLELINRLQSSMAAETNSRSFVSAAMGNPARQLIKR